MLARSGSDLRVRAGLIRIRASIGFPEAVRHLENALGLFGTAGDPGRWERCRALGGALSTHHSVMDIPRAIEHFAAAERTLADTSTAFTAPGPRRRLPCSASATPCSGPPASRWSSRPGSRTGRPRRTGGLGRPGWLRFNSGELARADPHRESAWTAAHDAGDAYSAWGAVASAALCATDYLLDPATGRAWCRRGRSTSLRHVRPPARGRPDQRRRAGGDGRHRRRPRDRTTAPGRRGRATPAPCSSAGSGKRPSGPGQRRWPGRGPRGPPRRAVQRPLAGRSETTAAAMSTGPSMPGSLALEAPRWTASGADRDARQGRAHPPPHRDRRRGCGVGPPRALRGDPGRGEDWRRTRGHRRTCAGSPRHGSGRELRRRVRRVRRDLHCVPAAVAPGDALLAWAVSLREAGDLTGAAVHRGAALEVRADRRRDQVAYDGRLTQRGFNRASTRPGWLLDTRPPLPEDHHSTH